MEKKCRTAKLGWIGFLMSLAIGVIFLSSWNGAMAADNGTLKYKELHSYDEIMEYIEGDDYFYISDTSEEDGVHKVDELWTVNVDKPGWFMVFEYRSYYGVYDHCPVTPYLYTSKTLNKAVDRRYPESFQARMDGARYTGRDCHAFYLTEGTYYLNLFNKELYNSADVMAYALFLPFEDICKVDEITYNDDFSEAFVTFKYASDKWEFAKFASRKNTSQEALNGDSYWDYGYEYGKDHTYSSESDYWQGYKKFEEMLHEGITLTKNGDYTIYFSINKDELKGLAVMVNFTIDKIGTEASKVQAKSLKMSKTKATLKVGNELKLKVTFKPKNVTDKTVTWKSSNTKVATVDANGKVTAKKKGTCTITAISTNGKKAKCKITVKK